MRSAPFVFVLSLLCGWGLPVWADQLMDLEQAQEKQLEKRDILNPFIVDADPLGSLASGQPLYVHPELNRIVAHPTFDSTDANAWPNSDSKITVLGPEKKVVRSNDIDPVTGEVGYDVMVHVQIEYDYKGQHVSRPGWIKSTLLSRTPEKNLLEEKSDVVAKPASPPASCPQKIESVPPEHVVKKLKTAMVQQLDIQTEMLKKVTGSCPLSNPDQKDPNKGIPVNGNMYDRFLLLKTKQEDRKFSDLHLEKVGADGKTQAADAKDLMDIDTLARTLYSEMNRCFSAGIQYPMAVAKVALNRAEQGQANYEGRKQSLLCENLQNASKPTITKALVCDRQFSVWNPPSERGPKDLTLLMSLCPETSKGSKLNWAQKPAPEADVSIWNQSLSIAAMAILHRDEFNKLTKEVTQIDYNSIRAGEAPVAPSGLSLPAKPIHVGGRLMNYPHCLQLWDRK